MEYARLLEKETRFFCVRCIAAVAFLVLWEMGRAVRSPSPKGLDETPRCVKNEGRLKPPSFRGRQSKYGLYGERLQTSCRGRHVDIPLVADRRLISRPRKASIFHLR